MVEEQTSFCASCGAPQIRVAARESQPEHAGPPPPLPDSAPVSVVRLPVGTPDRVDWQRFLRVAAPLAGLVAVLTIYAAPVWLVLFPGSIFLAVYVYRRRQPGPLKTGQGLKMGILIGLITYTVLALYVAGVIARDPAGYRLETENGMKDAAAHNPNPQAAEVAQFFSGAKGVALFTVMAMALLLVFTLIIGGVSGALAASLARNKAGP